MPRLFFRSVLSVAGVLICAAPALAQSKAAIQKLEDQWGSRIQQGATRRRSLPCAIPMKESAHVLPAGRADGQGHVGHPGVLDPGDAAGFGDVKCTAIDVKPLGRKAAREIGTCTFKTKGATPQDGVLKYAVVWQKDDGQWKLLTDIWNMDK